MTPDQVSGFFDAGEGFIEGTIAAALVVLWLLALALHLGRGYMIRTTGNFVGPSSEKDGAQRSTRPSHRLEWNNRPDGVKPEDWYWFCGERVRAQLQRASHFGRERKASATDDVCGIGWRLSALAPFVPLRACEHGK